MKNYDSKILTGEILRSMIISGANNLFNHYPEIDALNVFPVPDGDTGTNMNLTMTSGAKEIMTIRSENIYDVAKIFSKGLLMGARGNSGVILSQIFRGFAKGLDGKSEIGPADFSAAWKKGSEMAYRGVLKPVEGTILTVIRESSEALSKNLEACTSIGKAMEVVLENAKIALEHTPELLPVLKEVGVVDSGGAGLVKIFEGMLAGLKGEIIERRQITLKQSKEDKAKQEIVEYCIEVKATLGEEPAKKKYDEARFLKVLSGFAKIEKSVKKDQEIILHVHTDKPGVVLNVIQVYGEFDVIKVENLKDGHNLILDNEIAIETPKEQQEYALISTSVGEGLDKLFKSLNVSYIVSGGQTMNPSTEDFVKAIKEVNARHVFIFPNNKNIVMAAEQACELVENCDCHVIKTKTIPQGLTACMMFDSDADVATNEEAMSEAITNVKSGQITFSIKDTKIDGINIKKDEFMAIFDSHIVASNKDKGTVLNELVDKMIDDDSSIVTLIYGYDVKETEAQKLADYISEKYGIEVEIHDGGQPVYSYFIGVE